MLLRHLAPLPLLLLPLAACGEEADSGDEPARAVPVSGRQETSDGAASFVLPKGWVQSAYELDGQVTFAAVDALDESRQIFITTGKSRDDAEAEALFAADALAKQGATCRRDRTDTTYGGTNRIVDCSWTEPTPYRKVMIALGDGDQGAMVLVAGQAKERADLADLVTPFLASWTWQD